MLETTVWYVALELEGAATALTREPPLAQQRFELTATLRAANVSLMALAPGARVSLPHNFLCCGVSLPNQTEHIHVLSHTTGQGFAERIRMRFLTTAFDLRV